MFVTEIERVRELLDAGWTKGHMAVDKNGEVVAPDSPKACSFCLLGAIMRVAGKAPAGTSTKMALPFYIVLKNRNERFLTLQYFNDTVAQTKDDILALIDDALVIAKEDGN